MGIVQFVVNKMGDRLIFDGHSFDIVKVDQDFNRFISVVCSYDDSQLSLLFNWHNLVVDKVNEVIFGYSDYKNVDSKMFLYFSDSSKFKHLASGVYCREGQIIQNDEIITVLNIIPLEINGDEKTVRFSCIKET